jgi:hypothetical protein
MPANLTTKVIGSKLREWGKTVNLQLLKTDLKRKYKANAASYRN